MTMAANYPALVVRTDDDLVLLDPRTVEILCGSPPEPVMNRYRRKPDPCLAAQWQPDGPSIPGVGMFEHGSGTVPAVKTAAGWHFLRPGEWVVCFSDGVWAVFGDEYFRATFEPIPEE